MGALEKTRPDPSCRLHIFGASGSGATSLGRALASDWSVPCHDTDDYYWLPTEPPFTEKRPIPERLELMERLFLPRSAWVLAGSLFSWSAPLIPYFDAVVFVSLDNDVRLERLRTREVARYGLENTKPGGAYHDKLHQFLAWANRYEDPNFEGRSRKRHEAWLSTLSCPIIRVESRAPVDQLVQTVNSALLSR